MSPAAIARRDDLIDRIAAKHGTDGLLVVVLALETMCKLRGQRAATKMSAFLSEVAAQKPAMLSYAVYLARGFVEMKS